MAKGIIVSVPDLGDFHDVEVIDVLVQAGDTVAVDTPLITLETDKATMDVPSTAAGRVAALAVKKGDRVSKGSAILELEAASPAAAAKIPPAPKSASAAKAPPAPDVGAPKTAELEVRVPDLGDFKNVEVIEVLVKAGDAVALETPLLTLETEKATMDVPSSAAGTLTKLHVAKGARVNAGDLVATVKGSAPAAGKAAAPAAAVTPPASAAAPPAAAGTAKPAASIASTDVRTAHAGPAVRRFSRELGVDLSLVRGTGLKGRVSEDDVKAFVKQALAAPQRAGPGAVATGSGLPRVPEVDFAAFGPIEVRPLGRIQRISGARLQASWVNLPHVTQFDEADITEMEKLRGSLKERAAGLGIKLTPLAFIARACVRVIAQFPNFASSLDSSAQNQVFKKYLHLGFAADTPNGLVVPVIRDAGRKDIYELARDLADLAGKARGGKLTAAEMQGGCFTISSLGGIGGTAFTPIINAPEVAILGVSRSQQRPIWKDGRFEPRLMLPLSLSYDHRVIDGAEAVRFVVALAEALAAPHSLTEAVP